mmetsp:Transcript_66618/g.171454  ORF Transcript_66618/g.171454 Transcript_66618/m.171454 type:complete len:156 (+) Transcript_66618:61-528(+)
MGANCCASSDASKEAAFTPDPMGEHAMQQEQNAIEAAAMYAAGFGDVSKNEGGTELQRTVEVTVRKLGPEDRLGMDVKHVRGRLVIVQLFPGGAVHRANKASAARKPPGDTVDVGDVIVQVNDVKGIDTDMVAECQQRDELRIRAVRKGGYVPAP